MELLELDSDLLPSGSSLLHLAANNEDAAPLRELLERDPSHIDDLDRHNRTPLAVALHNGRIDAARTLIEFGASLEVPFEKDGQTILQMLSGRATPFQLLIESIVEHDVSIPFAPGILFPIAAFEGKADTLEKLLSRYEVDINYKDSLQRTALHYACQSGNMHCINLLLQYRASKVVTDLRKSTPLHLACGAGHLEAVQALLEDNLSYEPHASVLNSQDAVGCTPIHAALYSKQFGVSVYLLVEFRADLDLTLVDSNGYTIPSLLFSLRCSFGVIPASFEHLLPCMSQEEATWLLHESVSRQNLEMVVFSIAQGAAVDCCDFMWQTPLLLASKVGSVEVCRHLVEQGASLNVCDPGGKCPLQYAAEMGHLETVSFFLSQHEIDPTPMYARYTHPVSPGLLQLLLDFFQGNPLAPKPQNWRKWLTLAAPASSGDSFSHLVESICPSISWIEALASGEVCGEDQLTVVEHRLEKSLLPFQTEIPEKNDTKPRKTRTRGPKKWKNRTTKKSHFVSTPKGFVTLPAKKKKVPKRVFSKFKGKPFTFLFKETNQKYSPLHVAVQCGNSDVIDFILSAAERQGVQSQLLQLEDDSGRMVSELVAGTSVPPLSPDLERRLDVRMEEHCPLPDGVTFEEALLHYLLVGGPSTVNHVPHSKAMPSVTPLDQWPQRCVQDKIVAYAKKLGTAPVSLLTEEDRQSFLELILEWSSPPLDRSLGPYPGLLYTAVQWKCVWGVRLLLNHGAPVTAQAGNEHNPPITPPLKSRRAAIRLGQRATTPEQITPRYALLEAAKQSQVETIDLLLQNGFSPFLQMPDLGHLCESLCHHLVSLANQGLFQSVKKLTDGLPVKEYLWGLPSGPKLLYVTLALGELDLGISLVRNFVSFLCTAIANWEALDGTFHSNVKQCLERLKCYTHTFEKVRDDTVRLFVSLVSLGSIAGAPGLLFHRICGYGLTGVVRMILECAGESNISSSLVSKLDSKKRSPLFYAACGGHLDIIKLLIDKGSILYSPSSKAPIIGCLLYLCCAPHAQEHSAEHCGTFKSGRKLTYRTRHAFLTSGVADMLPHSCHFSLAFRNPDQARQLATLLMPTSDAEWLKVLVTPQTKRKAAWFNPLWLAAAIANPTPIEPLLERLLEHLLADISLIQTSSKELLVTHYPVVAPVYHSRHTTEMPTTILDAAVLLAPFKSDSSSSATLESVLVQYASCVPLHELVLASSKGYWGVVRAALSFMSGGSQFSHVWPSYQVSNPEILKQCQKILPLAAKQGETSVIETLLSVAEQDTTHPSKSLQLSLFEGAVDRKTRPLYLAVKHDHLEILLPLVNSGDDLVAGLEAAARWNRRNALSILIDCTTNTDSELLAQCIDKLVSTAARHGHAEILEYLLPQYENPELVISSDLPYRSVSFWFQVLLESAKCGHESLSLQAVACISDSQLDQLTNHRKYCDVLYWACYWGMSELLECLPFAAPQLLERSCGAASPWECAIANGRIGRLSNVSNFPQIPANLDEWLRDSPLGVSPVDDSEYRISAFFHSLFSGCFHKLCSGRYDVPAVAPWQPVESLTDCTMHSSVQYCTGLQLFYAAIAFNVPHIVEAYLQNLGSYAGTVLRLLQTELHYPILHQACSNGGSKEVLEALLRALFDANLLTEALQDLCETEGSPLAVAIKNGSVSCTETILRCGQPSLMQYVSTSNGDTLLHLAVRSKNAELVELVLKSLGEEAPDSCFTTNDAGEYPLLLAVALGRCGISPLLLKRAVESSKWSQTLSPDWRREAKLARGWFQLLMKETSLLAQTSPQSSIQPCEMNIRLGHMTHLFVAAVKNQNTLIVRALLAASAGLLLDRSVLSKVLLDSTVLDFLANTTLYGDQSLLTDFDATRSAIHAIERGRTSEVMQLVKLVCSSRITVVLDIKKVFLAACNRAQFDLIESLLNSSERKIKTALDSAALKEGIIAAVTCSSFDAAAYIQLKTKLPFKKELIPEGAQVSHLVDTIFGCNTSYLTLIEKFFASITSKNTVSERLPFSATWLRHQWTAYQYQLVMNQMGGGSAPPNPWNLPVTIGEDNQTISLNVDWDSFIECFVGSPIVGVPTTFQEVPLLIEATVFSPSVLGQLYCCSENSDSRSIIHFLPLDSPAPSSIILSSVVWPQEPSMSISPDGLGILTLSYQPEERMFLFPSSSITEAAVSFASSNSGIQSFAYSPESCQYMEYLVNLVQHTSELLNRESKGKYLVHIGLGDGVPHITYCNTFSAVFQAMQTTLRDCAEVFELLRSPAVLYSHLKPGIRPSNVSRLSPPESAFASVRISFTLESSIRRSPLEVGMENGDLYIDINIDPAGTPRDMALEVPPFEALLKNVTDCVLLAELDKLKLDLMTTLTKKTVARLQRSLKGRLGLEAVSLLMQDQLGATHRLDELTTEHLLQLKELPKVRKVLSLFSDMLQVMSYKPRLHSSVRALFDAGFRIVASDSDDTGFTLKAGVPQLTVSTNVVHRSTFEKNLLDTFVSVVRAASVRRQSVQDFGAEVLAPFLCSVVWDESMGLLYPTVGAKGSIVVQLVSYSKQKLTELPKSKCCLDVVIKSPTPKVYRASSSEDPSPHSASKFLLVRTKKEGVFEIEWTPNEEGIHLVTVSINGTLISSSPFKAFVGGSSTEYRPRRDGDFGKSHWAWGKGSCGSRHTSTDVPLVFIAAHPPLHCSYNTRSPITLAHRKPIIPLTSSPSTKLMDSSTQEGVEQLFPTGSDPARVHHLSVTSAGGSDKWKQVIDFRVMVFTTSGSYLQSHCLPLGNGLYRIVLSCISVGTFKVFAACTACQCVMELQWADQRAFHPLSCYILPGPFSPHCSSLSTRKPKPSQKPSRKPPKSGPVGSFSAGSTVALYLRARDSYSNAHTTGGAVQKVVIKGAGRRHFDPNAELANFVQEHRHGAPDVECSVEHIGSGVYQIGCQVFTAGNHSVCITDQCGSTKPMGTLQVLSGGPHAPLCRLDPRNSYQGVTTQGFTCYLYTFDQFLNPHSVSGAGDCGSVHASVGNQLMTVLPASQVTRGKRPIVATFTLLALTFTPSSKGVQQLNVTVGSEAIPACPVEVNIVPFTDCFPVKLKILRRYLTSHHCIGYTPTITINRDDILESAVRELQDQYFHRIIRVRFGEEVGIDTGGVAREFFHLLCQEFINPQYALFQCVNGLYRPNPNSSVNLNHLFYFTFFGKFLAKTICDGHQMTVRFTPAVYKFLLRQECVLDDLKIEDPSLYSSLVELQNCESQEELQQLAMTFTASRANFGALETVELERGGEGREVTLENKAEFVNKLFKWHLTGCIREQLGSLMQGFTSLVPSSELESFSAHELEVVLSGQPTIDLQFLRSRTKFTGYSASSNVVQWLWQVLAEFTQEQRCQFLQFTTGCACLPAAETGQWELHIKSGSNDSSLLPVAATCFNAITLPHYTSKNALKQKLELAISYGQQTFLLH